MTSNLAVNLNTFLAVLHVLHVLQVPWKNLENLVLQLRPITNPSTEKF